MILCNNWHDFTLQVSIKNYMCTLLDEMELVRNVAQRN